MHVRFWIFAQELQKDRDMRKKVLIFSRDPGGANAVIQLIDPLLEKGYDVEVYGKDAAISVYKKFYNLYKDISKELDNINLETICTFIKRIAPDFIITGTSSDDFTERYIWTVSETMGIPAFAVLDQWINYSLRFKNTSCIGEFYLPTKIFIMDEYAQNEMCKEGIDKDRIVVTGQPFFEYVRKNKFKFDSGQIEKFKEEIVGSKNTLLFVFVSQPISTLCLLNEMEEDYWGYTEKDIFLKVIRCLEKICNGSDKNIMLVIRMHPKDKIDNYADIINKNCTNVRCIFDNEFDSNLLLMASDLIIGMYSMLLLEAAILDRKFISVQIGLKRENPLILDRIGINKSILTKNELEEVLYNTIFNDYDKRKSYQINFRGIENIIKYVEEYVWEN
jgi:hypothetical protein